MVIDRIFLGIYNKINRILSISFPFFNQPYCSSINLILGFCQKQKNNLILGFRIYQGITKTEEWTDEKHSMYIKSIEASFVNQLYDSKQTRPSFSRRGNSNEPTSTSGQVSFSNSQIFFHFFLIAFLGS